MRYEYEIFEIYTYKVIATDVTNMM